MTTNKQIEIFIYALIFLVLQFIFIHNLNIVTERVVIKEESLFPVVSGSVIINNKTYPVDQFIKQTEMMYELREKYEKSFTVERTPEVIHDVLVRMKPSTAMERAPMHTDLLILVQLFHRLHNQYNTEIHKIVKVLRKKANDRSWTDEAFRRSVNYVEKE